MGQVTKEALPASYFGLGRVSISIMYRKNNKLKDPPYRVVHIYKDGRTVVESCHNLVANAINAAKLYKNEVFYNTYAVQKLEVVRVKGKSIEYRWTIVRIFP